MSTAGALINRVSQQLLSGTTEERNKLATTVTGSETSIVTTYDLAGLRAGTVFEIDSELMYVWTATTSTKTLLVERGYLGTTAAAHTATALIIVNPRFPQGQMLSALNADIDDISSPVNGLYRVVATTLTYNGADRQINLTDATSVIDLIEVRLRYLASDNPILRMVRLDKNLSTADFASGYAITFDEPTQSGTVRVVYRAPFVRAVTTASDIQTVCFVPESMEDILEMGLLLRMMAGREIKRNFIESQGDTRRPEEVPPGATIDSVSSVQRLRRDRILAEAAKLMRQYPLTIRK